VGETADLDANGPLHEGVAGTGEQGLDLVEPFLGHVHLVAALGPVVDMATPFVSPDAFSDVGEPRPPAVPSVEGVFEKRPPDGRMKPPAALLGILAKGDLEDDDDQRIQDAPCMLIWRISITACFDERPSKPVK